MGNVGGERVGNAIRGDWTKFENGILLVYGFHFFTGCDEYWERQ